MSISSGEWSAVDECESCKLLLEEKKKLEALLVAKDKEIEDKVAKFVRLKNLFKEYKTESITGGRATLIILIVGLFGMAAGYVVGSGNALNVSNSIVGVDLDFKELYEESQRTLFEKDKKIQILETAECNQRRTIFILAVVLMGFSLYHVWKLRENVEVEIPSKGKLPWMGAELDRLSLKYILCETTFDTLLQSIMALEVGEDRQSVKGELHTLEELYWKAAKNVEECIVETVKAVEDKLKECTVISEIDTAKNDAKEEEDKEVGAKEEVVNKQESHTKEEGIREEIREGNKKPIVTV